MEEIKEIALLSRKDYMAGARDLEKVQVGHWYSFHVNNTLIGFGKVVSVNGKKAKVERYFELPSYRPYAGHKWFDDLKRAVAD